SSKSYPCYEVLGQIDFDLAFHTAFVLNQKLTLSWRIDYRRVDIRQTNNAKTVLCEVFDWSCRLRQRVGPRLFPAPRHRPHHNLRDLCVGLTDCPQLDGNQVGIRKGLKIH